MGGRLISKGRNKVFIWSNILALISCLSMQYISVWVLAAGKFFNGIFVTIVHIAQIKMINEMVPVYHLGKYGPAVQIMSSSGYLILFSIGTSGLPKSEYDPDLDHSVAGAANTLAYIDAKNDNFWRVIFIVPLFINILMIISFLIFIREDSLMFNVVNHKDDEALKLIKKVYAKSEDPDLILSALKLQCE